MSEPIPDLVANLEASLAKAKVGKDWPIRQRSARGLPKPNTSIERTCKRCGAAMLGLAPGSTQERGIWKDWAWYCSQECFDGPLSVDPRDYRPAHNSHGDTPC